MKTFAAICILFLTTGCALLQSARIIGEADPEPIISQISSVEVSWDPDPDMPIIQVSADSGGSAPNAALVNELFAAQVWGDGRIIWITWTDDFQRQVWQGQLSETEMAALLETFSDKDFFRMKTRYAPRENVMDGSTIRISVKLLTETKEVSEYFSGAPDEFHELVDLLTSGAGAAGTLYLPQSGHLAAREIQSRDWLEIPLWDAAALGLDLHDAGSMWIEGDALMQAWEAVNRSPAFPVVVQDGSYFELHLRLPELSVMAPR